jgi:saccharopine dehydrogenase-like NADP-dependent oxidoreductase
MATILIIGAGKSSSCLISFLLETALEKGRKLIIADISETAALEKCDNHPAAVASGIDLQNHGSRKDLIACADVVISMLPAFLHPIIAQDCLELKKHFFTASYESEAMRQMSEEILSNDLLFLNECGLDPGIDHMSAMKIIHDQQSQGHKILSFKSYCGGLLSPRSEEDNPWKYKFTWNARNVVLAGQGVSKYISEGEYKYIPYHKLFQNTETIFFDHYGNFEAYPNRDSLSYRKQYNLEGIPTLLRGTLRKPGFCQSWDILVQLGLTDDTYVLSFPENCTNRQFLNSFLPNHHGEDITESIIQYLPGITDTALKNLVWLGLLEEKPLPKFKGSPAAILQAILEEKWVLKESDHDLVVMQHQFVINTSLGDKSLISSLVLEGEDNGKTAMAKTVGLPLAIIVDLFLEGKINIRGLHIPVLPEIYIPVLEVLSKQGITFREKEQSLT